jgi:hypothetical protein
MSAGSQPIDNVGSLGIDKEEDTVNVNGAPHYLLTSVELHLWVGPRALSGKKKELR